MSSRTTQAGQRHIYSSVAETTMGDGRIVTQGGQRDIDHFVDGAIMPQDVICEILLLLPVKSLIRFRCVSKAWKQVISSPDFAYLHYSKSCQRGGGSNGYLVDIMVTVELVAAGLLDLYRLTVDTKTIDNQQKQKHEEQEELGLQQVYQPPDIHRLWNAERHEGSREFLLGPCWGLYCKLSSYGEKFALWNPATREAKVVRLPWTPPRSYKLYPIGYGFGACSQNDGNPSDFKFVRILHNTVVRKKILEVYSSRNECWHVMESSVGPSCNANYHGILGVELNQVIHWYMKNLESHGPNFIFTFNLGDETCGTIDLPLQVVRDRVVAGGYSLSTMNNQYLSLIVLNQIMYSDYADIWIMHEHAAWTKHTRVELKGQVARVWGYWNNVEGGIVFGQDDRWVDDDFLPYDPRIGKNLVLFINDNVRSRLPLKKIGRLTVINYTESLVRLS